MKAIKTLLGRIKNFVQRNLGLIIIVSGNVVPIVIFILGVVLVENTWEHLNYKIDNRTFIWVIAVPFFILVLTFLGQLIFHRLETRKELMEQRTLYENQLEEIKSLNNRRFDEVKHYQALFSVIDDVNNKDIYSSTIFGFLVDKFKKDIKLVKSRNFIAEGWYWKLCNTFLLHEKSALCTCILSFEQLSEVEIHEYFKEQYEAINKKGFDLERVLIVDTLSELSEYAYFVSEQLNNGVKFYILSKEFPEIKNISEESWRKDFKRDFSLINSKYLIEAQIISNDLRGYEIKEINGITPSFAVNVLRHRKPVNDYISYFASGSYNPVSEIINSKSLIKR